MNPEIQKLMDQNPDGEHPVYVRSDWKYEVHQEDTKLGYWDWVDHCVEEEGFDRSNYKFRTLSHYALLWCKDCSGAVGRQARYISRDQYDREMARANRGWACPSCGEYPCGFDEEYFERPLVPAQTLVDMAQLAVDMDDRYLTKEPDPELIAFTRRLGDLKRRLDAYFS